MTKLHRMKVNGVISGMMFGRIHPMMTMVGGLSGTKYEDGMHMLFDVAHATWWFWFAII